MTYISRLLIALLILAVPVSSPVVAQDEDGGGFLERLIEDNLSGAGRVVTIQGFAGALSSRARLDTLTIADSEGVWLTLRDVVLDWNRSALLRGRLEVTELTAAEILLPRAPVSESTAPSPEATPFKLPDLPVSVQIGKVAAEKVSLGEALFGAAADVSLEGSVSLAGGAGEADIAIRRIDGREGSLTLKVAYDNGTEVLALNLDVAEGEDGIAANLLTLPGKPSVHLTVAGDGPLADFTADIGLETDGEPRITGTVALSADGTGDAVTRRFSANIGGDIAPVFAPRYRPFFGPDIRLIAEGQREPDGRTVLDRFSLTADALSLNGQVVIAANGLPEKIDVTGEIIAADGTSVLLPMGGESTQVGRVGLNVQFDAAQGEDWTGDITLEDLDLATIDIGRVVLDGSGQIADDAGAKTVTAGFDFSVTGLSAADPSVAQALGDSATGSIAIDWATGAPLALRKLRLTGASFDLDGSGQVTFGDRVLATLKAVLNADDLTAFSGLAGRTLDGSAALDIDLSAAPLDGSFDVTLGGTATNLSVDQPQADALLAGETRLSLRADRDETGTRLSELTLTNPALELAASGDLKSEASSLRADIRMVESAVLDPRLSGPIEVTALAQQAGSAWNYELRGAGAGAEIDSTGTVSGLDDPSFRITTETKATIADLAGFSGLAGRDLAGSADLRVNGFVLADLSLADATVDGTTQGIRIGDARIDDLLIGQTDLSLRVQRDGPVVTFPRFTLNGAGAGLRATGSAEVRGVMDAAPLISGAVEFSANRLSPFSALAGRPLDGAVTGKVSGSARMDGSEADLLIDANGRSVRTGIDGLDPVLAGIVELAGRVKRVEDTVTIDDLVLSAEAPGLRLTGSARAEDITGSAPLAALDGTLAVDDLSKFSGLAGRELGGAVDVTVDATARTGLSVLDAVLDGETRNLRLGQENADRLLRGVTKLALSARRDGDVIDLSRLNITNPQITAVADGRYNAGQSALKADVTIADLSDLDARMTGSGKVNLFAEEVGDVWQVTLDGDAADAVVRATAEVRNALSGNPTVAGSANVDARDLSRFAPLANRPLGGALTAQLSGSARADLGVFDVDATVDGRNLRIGVPEADRILGAQTDLRIVARRTGPDSPIDVETFRAQTPMLSATANGTVLGNDANLTVDARLADIAPFVPGFSGPVTAGGTIRSAGSTLNLNVTGTGPGGITLRATGDVQQDFSRANLSVAGRAPLALANSFIEPRLLDGTLAFDLGINGPLALSSVSGQLSSSDARLVAPALGVVLENIALTANLGGNTAQLNLQAEKQGGGRLTVTGPITLSGGFNADLAIDARGLVFEDPRLYRTVLDGRIGVNGPLTGGARISGTLNLGETEVRIPSTGLGATGPIPDGLVHVNEPAAVRATRERAGMIEQAGSGSGGSGGGVAYPLDLTIQATNRIFIRGRGLDAEMGGALTLRGTTANVIPAGQFDLVRGRLDLLGKRLTMDEGRVTLQGDFTPFIRLVARTDAGDVVVIIVIEGEALSPEIDFLSEPSLPEEEVLARLLFGKSITSISPLQAAQLASAVATLAGKGGDGVIGKLRNSFGLDDLDITTDDEGNAGVRAGKYLSENVYTDVTIEAGGDATINLNLDLSPSLTIKGGASNSGETSLGIFYEKDY
ncbi:translocation/assembly module TamB domain-containing protein [Oceaniovalibus sp. ACAM 378]|uniref:translocation/assembly module TamB domain-containing protein n=1 Tax=Oceaniovalibus sp. ACAM 378 TaxID=2599923 RepID=UPI0011D33ECB|nr:translocation/assembly module TamB domain-containing protein [Oceaniovalibus sp. ACAM 378]TYB89245.1 hypothetical protein FQ320_10075 [Oceaniovalibus sp. ACAM 378]